MARVAPAGVGKKSNRRMLLKASEHDAYILFAGMAMMKALNFGKPEEPREPRRKAVKKYRIMR